MVATIRRIAPTAVPLALLALAGCDGYAFREADDYSYINAPGVQPALIHEFADVEGVFSGTCEAAATFLVMDGDWDHAARQFTVTVDGRTRAFPIFADARATNLVPLPEGTAGSDAHARDAAAIANMLAQARGRITFRVGDWAATAPASPEIARFITACRDWRAEHPFEQQGDTSAA